MMAFGLNLAGNFVPGISEERRKRLGQYFTGDKLARLLALIAKGDQCLSAIDPMCGSGDMIAAVKSIAPSAKLAGIEIDPNVMELCVNRFGKNSNNNPYLIQGNAFSWSTISLLPFTSFDLVITNPPYVRYQNLAEHGQNEAKDFPSAESIRYGLLEVAERLSGLSDRDREIFISIIEGYSGLADLAVPSWILCAMLTAVGGRLAMVVPESWLNRDYAYPIHYMLLKLFRIQYVIEDAQSVWFNDAQIKTNLIVAKRIPIVDDISTSCTGRSYLHVTLPASAMDSRSIVGRIFPEEKDPDVAFAKELDRFNTSTEEVYHSGFSLSRRSLESKLRDLVSTSWKSKWFRNCEPNFNKKASSWGNVIGRGIIIPQALLDLIEPGISRHFITIEELGGRVGQGLRTGANAFFYCDLLYESEEGCLVMPGKALGIPSVLVPKDALRHVLRKQNEISGHYQLDQSKLRGRVLILENYIHPDDLKKINQQSWGEILKKSGRCVMPQSLAEFVTVAARTNVGTLDNPKFIPKMSAVRTNESKGKRNDVSTARYWYMLPPLAPRHLPDLFVPRVNHLHPKVMMNSSDKTVIDANFSTIWLEPGASVDTYALLAFLNSSWAIAAMELSAVVMGGGALKLEATHLRRLPIPVLSCDQWAELSLLGRLLTSEEKTSEILLRIDRLIATAVFGIERVEFGLQAIEKIKKEKLDTRTKK